MSGEEFSEDDTLRHLFEEADSVVNSPRTEQLAWLAKLRELNEDLPNADELVERMESYLGVSQDLTKLKIQQVLIGENMEARFLSELNELLSRPDSEWAKFSDAKLLNLARLSVIAHLLEPLRERCQESDAQERLDFIYQNFLMHEDRKIERE